VLAPGKACGRGEAEGRGRGGGEGGRGGEVKRGRRGRGGGKRVTYNALGVLLGFSLLDGHVHVGVEDLPQGLDGLHPELGQRLHTHTFAFRFAV
jgi:hypothetical protein